MPADGLFCRDVGDGPPIVVVHGGPDFDHAYLLPELDRLADAFRLVYHDQRGRGRSAEGVLPADVTIRSESKTSTRFEAASGWSRSRSSGTRGAGSWGWSTPSATPIASPT